MPGKAHLASYLLLQVVFFVNALEQSCTNTQTVFTSVFGAASSSGSGIYSSLKSTQIIDNPEGVCHIDQTCCSGEVENMFQSNMNQNFRKNFVDQLTSHLGICRNPSIFNATVNFVLTDKLVIRQDLEIGNYVQNIDNLNENYRIFDNFLDYLASAILTGNLEELRDKYFEMFFELFLVVYFDESEYYPGTADKRQCFYNFFHEQKGSIIDSTLGNIKKGIKPLMQYLRALRAGDRLIDSILRYRLTEQCEMSLMKMTHCANCAGYLSSLKSCNGLCVNTVRGCFVDLLDLVEPIKAYSEALAAMNNRNVQQSFGSITKINTYIFDELRELTSNQRDIVQRVNAMCGVNRKKRNTSPSARPLRSKRALVLVENPRPYDELDASSTCLLDNIGAFNSTTDALCEEEGGVNTECWNGKIHGSYERSVLPYDRFEQRNNPELVVCQKSQFIRDIALLRYITKEMTSITSRCSLDDEDCIEVKDTDRYYDFDSIDLSSFTPNEAEEMMSGSGSGSGDDDDEEMCRRIEIIETTPPPVETTPTVLIPEDTPTVVVTFNATTDDFATVNAQNGSNKLSSGFSLFLSLGLTALLLATSSYY